MKKDDVVITVAIHMRSIIGGLEAHVSELVEGAPCNIVLLIGAGDVVQYAANVPREDGCQMITDVLRRWQADVPGVLPEAAVPVSPAFRLLLELLECASPDERENARHNLVRYVHDLEGRAKR